MFGSKKIEKVLEIEGMSCAHCAKKVEDALNAVKGVKEAKVNLESKSANVVMKEEIAPDVLKNAVEEVGYTVTNIK